MDTLRLRFVESLRDSIPTELEVDYIISLYCQERDEEVTGEQVDSLITYVLANHAVDKSISENEIDEIIEQMIIDKTLENLVQRDILDVSFDEDETVYKLTDMGNEIAKELKRKQ
jgi:hypothetical protein